MSSILNNKGQMKSYVAILAFLFIFGISVMISMVLLIDMKDAWVSSGLYDGQIEQTGDQFIAGLQVFDYISVLVMVFMIIGIILTSYKLATAPGFFVVTMFFGAFLGFLSYILNYIFIQFISNPVIATAQVYFPKTILLCTNLHWVSLAAIVLGSIALYAKRPSEGGTFIQ